MVGTQFRLMTSLTCQIPHLSWDSSLWLSDSEFGPGPAAAQAQRCVLPPAWAAVSRQNRAPGLRCAPFGLTIGLDLSLHRLTSVRWLLNMTQDRHIVISSLPAHFSWGKLKKINKKIVSPARLSDPVVPTTSVSGPCSAAHSLHLSWTCRPGGEPRPCRL